MSDLGKRREVPWRDPIVAEVRAARLALLEEAGDDLHELCRRLRKSQQDRGHLVIQRPPRLVQEEEGLVA